MEEMIYGVSSRYSFGQWEHVVFHFNDMDSAQKCCVLAMMLIQKHISTHIMSRVIMTYQQSLALLMYLL